MGTGTVFVTETHWLHKHDTNMRYRWFRRPIIPSTCVSKGRRYSRDDICDIVEMINEGWNPLDVAAAFDMGVYRRKDGGYRSTVGNNYVVWNAWYEAYGQSYRQRTATAMVGR